ncbi:MAG TPA: hypothetical protein VFE47_24740 [Tepidisphaeraceae bacterium]|jgi:hypothetical protein|nr:hypothetical protein [Tepidisphaeraceae bacterium]
MDIWLLTIELALAIFVGMAFWFALFARTNSRVFYIALGMIFWLIPAGGSCALAAASYTIHSHGNALVYLPQAVTLAAVSVLGGLFLLVRGGLRQDWKLRAARWKLLPLLALWILIGGGEAYTSKKLDEKAKLCAEETRNQTAKDYAAITGSMPADADNARDLYNQAFKIINDQMDAFDAERAATANAASAKPQTVPAVPATQPAPAEEIKRASDFLYKDEADRPESHALVARMKPAIALLKRAALMRNCRFAPAAKVPDLASEVPARGLHLSEFRHAAILLQTHAVQMAHEGNPAEAMADIQTMSLMSEHIDQTFPFLVSGLVREGCESVTISTLFDVLPYATNAGMLPDRVLADDTILTSEFERDMRGEEDTVLGTILNFADGKFGVTETNANTAKVAIGYRLLWLKPDVLATQSHMGAQRKNLASSHVHSPSGFNAGSPLIQVLLVANDRPRTVQLRFLGTARQGRLGIALTKYRLQHGAYPKTLESLTPDFIASLPLDPFDGKPMRYRLENGDAIIYSIGKDLKDDGGNIADRPTDDGFRLKNAVKVK